MAPIDKALEDLESREYPGRISYAFFARKHGVVASTLRRRHLAETQPRSLRNVQQQLLTPEQEQELVR
jgi:transposase-like protein